MLDHKDILKSLVIGAESEDNVAVRETNFGYIIRSDKGGRDDELRTRIIRLSLAAVWIAVAGIWLMPLGGAAVAVKSGLSLLLLAGAYFGLIWSRRDANGYELHVDTARRELRSAVLTSKGESWIRNSARFGEVTAPILRRGKPENEKRSLSLQIAGEDEVMPVAVGDESTLLAIHDRLMRDLRPLEERITGLISGGRAATELGARVFPQLGPAETS